MKLISKGTNTPYMNVIFGNFYSPAFDDENFVDETMALIRKLGYTSVMFDTKAWEDFKERYEGGEASQYVKMQEYMGHSAHRHGLAYNFLLLYMNGDNLYPHIRYSPPIFGEQTVYLDGTPGRWYKYWSEKARNSMKEHVDRIMERYGDGCERCLLGTDEEEKRNALNSGCGERSLESSDSRCQNKRQNEWDSECGKKSLESSDSECQDKRRNDLDCESMERSLNSLAAGEQWKNLYGQGQERREVIPVCSMWDPVVSPSFDEEGQNRYRSFLKKLYHGDIAALNRTYGAAAASFEQLHPEEYWYGVRYGADSFYTEEDVENRTPRFYVWRDNAFWKMEELALYFEQIGPMLKEKNPDLFLCPDFTQWGYFLNIYGRQQQDLDNEFSDLWDTAMRGIDLYRVAPYVDSCHFITVPVTPDGCADAYVVSCQHSMMRVMNEGKPFIGGIYWGRYIYQDLYAQLSPAEIIGSMTACGMDGYTCYGMNGLDDGGVMNRMDEDFLESLRLANAWCKEVLALRKGERKKEIAILFPSEMAALEPFEVGNNKIRRLDLLGWYRLCCDLGYQTDVISCHEIRRGALWDYRVLIVPSNDCYFAAEHEEAEQSIQDWAAAGGVVLHGPCDQLAERCFGIQGEPCLKKPYRYGKTIIAQGERFCRYHGGEVIAPYVDDAGCCVAAYAGETLRERMDTACRGSEKTEAEYTSETDRTRIAGRSEEDCAGEMGGTHIVEGTEKHFRREAAEESREVKGTVYSFGVQIGASYAAKNIPHVPYEQGNKEMYPIIQSQTTLLRDILYRHITPASGICERGIETGVFGNGMVIVNHRSTPYVLPQVYPTELYQYPDHARRAGRGVLYGHEAVWVSEG